MISKEQFTHLLEKLRNGTASEEERALLDAYYNLFELEPDVLKSMTEKDKLALQDEMDTNLFNEIAILQHTTKKRRLRFMWLGTAAATLVMMVSLGFYLRERTVSPSPENPVIADSNPGGDKATLTLSDGSKITLDEGMNGKVAQEGAVTITKTSNGELVYHVNPAGSPTENISYNKLETPRGGQFHLVLPDGSHVWLNASSSIRFPSTFAANERKVELAGEAYFEIAKSKDKPFQVASEEQFIEVLGTHFNVNAYSNEARVTTTLLEGSVKITPVGGTSAVVLKPGQESHFDRARRSFALTNNIDTENSIAWKNGLFQFDGADLHEIMRQLERWYDVEADLTNVPKKEFSGVVPRDVKLSQVLKMMELTSKLKFKIVEKKEGGMERRIIMVK